MGVVMTTILWSLGVATLVPSVANAADASCPTLVAGDLIKVSGKPAIYALDNNLNYRYFPDGDVFKSWNSDESYSKYYKTITQACFDSLAQPAAAPYHVFYRAGSYLVKYLSSDTLYVVGLGNKLHPITDAAAKAIFGTNYTWKTIGLSEWPLYTKDTVTITEATVYPGALVKVDGKTYFVDEGKVLREVTAEGMTANRFKAAFVRTLSTSAIAGLTMGATISSEVTSLTKRVGDSTTPGTPSETKTGNLSVSLAADTPAAMDIPVNVSVDFLKLRLTAGSDADINVTGIKLSAYGLGTASEIDGVTIFNNGTRYGNARDIDSNKTAVINFTNPLVVKKGTTETIIVKAKVTGTGKYTLGIAAAADIMATSNINGSFPIQGNAMAGTNVAVGQLTIDDEGALSSVKLGDKEAIVAKFKVNNDNVEEIALNSVILKRDSASTASDSAVENLKLYVDGSVVATAANISGRYVAFNLASPLTILKNGVKRFTVRGDVVDGAGKNIILTFDSTSDVSATGKHYGYGSKIDITAFTNQTVNINAGAVSLEKVNAENTKLKKDTTDVVFGTFKVTPNSGKNVELSTLKLTLTSANDAAYAQIENVEVFLKNTNTVYDLALSGGKFQNTSMGLVLNSGVTYEFVVRADVKSTATNGDYIVKINDAAGGDMVLKETGNDTLITDITPNSVSLNKVQVEGATVALSKNALSTAFNAVVGTSNVEVFNFNIKAGSASNVKVTQLKFLDTNSNATKSVVSEFKLYRGADLIKTVSANELSSYVITFTDLNQIINADATAVYKLTASLVKDSANNGETLNFRMSEYSAEETDKGTAVYDTTNDSDTNGVLNGVGVANMTSPRTVTVKGYGSLTVNVDNLANETKYDTWQLAGSEMVSVASFKLKADNEDIKVTKVKVDTSADVSQNISRIALYNDGTLVADTTNIGATQSTLEQDFTVAGTQTYTLKVTFQKIGKDQPGQYNVQTTFKLSGIEAEGLSSGETLIDGDDDSTVEAGEIAYEDDVVNGITNASKTTGIVAAKVGTVSLPTTNNQGVNLSTKISSGVAANAAIIAITAPNTANTYSDGTLAKLALSNIKVNVQHNLTSYTATVERIGGSAAPVAGTGLTTYTSFAVSGSDYEIASGETAYFLVKLVPTFTGTYAGDTSIKVGLDLLNGTVKANSSAGANFEWADASGAAKLPVRIPGVTSVDGTLISN